MEVIYLGNEKRKMKTDDGMIEMYAIYLAEKSENGFKPLTYWSKGKAQNVIYKKELPKGEVGKTIEISFDRFGKVQF